MEGRWRSVLKYFSIIAIKFCLNILFLKINQYEHEVSVYNKRRGKLRALVHNCFSRDLDTYNSYTFYCLFINDLEKEHVESRIFKLSLVCYLTKNHLSYNFPKYNYFVFPSFKLHVRSFSVTDCSGDDSGRNKTAGYLSIFFIFPALTMWIPILWFTVVE